jgi:hypothetical protein
MSKKEKTSESRQKRLFCRQIYCLSYGENSKILQELMKQTTNEFSESIINFQEEKSSGNPDLRNSLKMTYEMWNPQNEIDENKHNLLFLFMTHPIDDFICRELKSFSKQNVYLILFLAGNAYANYLSSASTFACIENDAQFFGFYTVADMASNLATNIATVRKKLIFCLFTLFPI